MLEAFFLPSRLREGPGEGLLEFGDPLEIFSQNDTPSPNPSRKREGHMS
jgi:hypothetical protein